MAVDAGEEDCADDVVVVEDEGVDEVRTGGTFLDDEDDEDDGVDVEGFVVSGFVSGFAGAGFFEPAVEAAAGGFELGAGAGVLEVAAGVLVGAGDGEGDGVVVAGFGAEAGFALVALVFSLSVVVVVLDFSGIFSLDERIAGDVVVAVFPSLASLLGLSSGSNLGGSPLNSSSVIIRPLFCCSRAWYL